MLSGGGLGDPAGRPVRRPGAAERRLDELEPGRPHRARRVVVRARGAQRRRARLLVRAGGHRPQHRAAVPADRLHLARPQPLLRARRPQPLALAALRRGRLLAGGGLGVVGRGQPGPLQRHQRDAGHQRPARGRLDRAERAVRGLARGGADVWRARLAVPPRLRRLRQRQAAAGLAADPPRGPAAGGARAPARDGLGRAPGGGRLGAAARRAAARRRPRQAVRPDHERDRARAELAVAFAGAARVPDRFAGRPHAHLQAGLPAPGGGRVAHRPLVGRGARARRADARPPLGARGHHQRDGEDPRRRPDLGERRRTCSRSRGWACGRRTREWPRPEAPRQEPAPRGPAVWIGEVPK